MLAPVPNATNRYLRPFSFEARKADNYVIVTHGASIRVLLTRYFRYSVDEFNRLENPRNGEMICMGHDGEGKLELVGRVELEEGGEKEREEGMGEKKEKGAARYSFHKTLRSRKKGWSKERFVRMSG